MHPNYRTTLLIHHPVKMARSTRVFTYLRAAHVYSLPFAIIRNFDYHVHMEFSTSEITYGGEGRNSV